MSPEVTALDVSDHRPRRVPSKTWRELIKKACAYAGGWFEFCELCPSFASISSTRPGACLKIQFSYSHRFKNPPRPPFRKGGSQSPPFIKGDLGGFSDSLLVHPGGSSRPVGAFLKVPLCKGGLGGFLLGAPPSNPPLHPFRKGGNLSCLKPATNFCRPVLGWFMPEHTEAKLLNLSFPQGF